MKLPEFDGQPMTRREILIARHAFMLGAIFPAHDHGWTLPSAEGDGGACSEPEKT